MYVVLSGTLRCTISGVGGETEPRVRHAFEGHTVNVLFALGVYGKCLESVEALVKTDVYAISNDHFKGLFRLVCFGGGAQWGRWPMAVCSVSMLCVRSALKQPSCPPMCERSSRQSPPFCPPSIQQDGVGDGGADNTAAARDAIVLHGHGRASLQPIKRQAPPRRPTPRQPTP